MSTIRQFQVTFDCAERVGTGLVGEERLAALEAECARLLPLGAVRERLLYDGKDSCIVMRDVEGNEFCLD
ncbi:hypothetical protein KVH21_33255 [Streptomyces olivaceus]|nr:hypothetical protein [Streptomyces olivaceus]